MHKKFETKIHILGTEIQCFISGVGK